MSDPNVINPAEPPSGSGLHPATAGWVPPPGTAERNARAAAAQLDPTVAGPAASTPGPQAPERLTDSDSTEPMDRLLANLPFHPNTRQRHLPPVPGYDVLQYVGRGGMGIVYKARHQRLNRTVALKIIYPGADDEVTRERFDREVKALAALKHPNIVPVYDAGEWQGLPYCAMEFAPGGTLGAHLDRIRADRRGAVRLMAKVARAVATMHAAGVLHRDLKPLNVLLGENDEPLVADFGLARRVGAESDLTYTGLPVGTRQYMAPEQTLGRHTDYTVSCDVWALGVTLFEVLTGQRPFADDTTTDLYHRIRSEDPISCAEIAPDVPAELEAIVRHCLAKRPEGRYLSAAAVADDLENWLAGRPVTAPPVPAPVPPAPEPIRAPGVTRRGRVLLACAALVLVAFVVGGFSGAFRNETAPQTPAARVAAGERVKFTNDKGAPTVTWPQTPGHAVTSEVEYGYHWFKSTGHGIVALADEPWSGPIRVEADIAVRYTLERQAIEAGVYVGRRSWADQNIDHESLVWFGVGPRWNETNEKGKKRELACLKGLYWWHSNKPGVPTRDREVRHPWSDGGSADDPPRFAHVVIEVRENEIRGTVDGVSFQPWTSRAVLRDLNAISVDYPNLALGKFEPPAFGTGIGIFLRNAQCTVVNLSVSKLTP
jgi:serine/threonine protein kinase